MFDIGNNQLNFSTHLTFQSRIYVRLENELSGHRYDKSEITDVLHDTDIENYINGVSREELRSLLVR